MRLTTVIYMVTSTIQFTIVQDSIRYVYDKLEMAPLKLALPKTSPDLGAHDVLLHLDKSLVVQCGSSRIAKGDCICDDRVKDPKVIQVDDSRAVVYRHDAAKELVVAFRQTTTAYDWYINLAARLVPLPGFHDAKVHEGFLTQLEKIETMVLAEISLRWVFQDVRNYTLVISGYSMGGAMAMLFAAKYAKKLPTFKNIKTYTYASPRVGNLTFSKLIDTLSFPVIRYTIQDDIVALLPPRALGYVHGGVEFHSIPTSTGAILKTCDSTYDEDPACAFNLTNPLKFSHFHPNNKPTPDALFCPQV